jgi:hypothetical protein
VRNLQLKYQQRAMRVLRAKAEAVQQQKLEQQQLENENKNAKQHKLMTKENTSNSNSCNHQNGFVIDQIIPPFFMLIALFILFEAYLIEHEHSY